MNVHIYNSSNKLNQNFALQNDLSLQARAIRIINIFRFLLGLIFVLFYLYVGKIDWIDNENGPLFFSLSLAYLLFSITLLVITPLKSSAIVFFHPIQIVIDIIFIIMMMYAAGGIQSGIGLLLIITIVTASLVSNGRLALFYAAVATIGLLLEQSYQIAKWDLSASTYTQPVMLSLSCFATAWLAYILAKRMLQSEALASARGVDLENLEQINALITQEIQDGVLVIDQHAHIRHHNFQAHALLGHNQHDISSLTGYPNALRQAFEQWVNSNDSNNSVVIMLNHRELRLRFEPINGHHRSDGAVVFIQDWSQIQSASQQAKLAALGRLTANIAHEIRNPLSAISHANQLLQEEENNSASNIRMLQIIADNIQRIEQIIKDVLELNRRDRTHQEQINLQQFITDFYTQFCAVEKIPLTHFQMAPMIQNQNVTFDQRHLTQILWNLCRNGWQHSQKKPHSLRLQCIAPGASVLNIEVIDDGDGVAEQDRSKLFEPFYTTKKTGNGLGLYISRELAEANNARLSYEALESGSAFILQLKI